MTKSLLKINAILFIIIYMVFSVIGANLDCYSWSEEVRIGFGITYLFSGALSVVMQDGKF